MKLEKMKLPNDLASSLQKTEKRWINVQSTTVTFVSLTVFFLSLLVMYISDRMWDTAPTFRLVLMILTISSFTVAVISYFKKKSNYTKSPYKIINLIQGHFTSLGDSLQGAVELSDDSMRPNNISQELCEAAIGQVANKTSKLNFNASVKTSGRNRFLRYFILLAVVIVAFIFVEPRAMVNSFQRWVNPFSDLPRYTFVELNQLPEEKVVLHGESFTIDVSVKDDSRIKPEAILWNFKGLEAVAETTVDGRVTLTLPGQTSETTLQISSYDYTKLIRIIPVNRPAVSTMMVNIKMPEYLKHADLSFEVQGNHLEVIKGSTYALKGKISNPLKEVKVYSGIKKTFDDAFHFSSLNNVIDSNEVITELVANQSIGTSLPVKIDGMDFTTDQLDPLKDKNLLFTWTDENSFSQKEPLEIKVAAVEDEGPFVDCEDLGRSFALLSTENIIFPIKAVDNFGVRYLKVLYEVHGAGNVNYARSFTKDVLRGSESTKELKGKFIFSPNQMKIPAGSTVRLFAITNDYLPGRKDVRSPEYKIYILSKEEHAKLIQERFDALTAKLEGVSMQEDENMQKNIETSKMTPEELDSAKGKQAIEEALNAEEANARKLGQLAKEGMDLVSEALKNDEFEEEQLTEWAEMMEKMEELAEDEMQDVQKSLAQAGKKAESGSKSPLVLEGLKAAIQKQEEILREMRRLSKDLDENMKKATLKGFAARLRNLSKEENSVANLLQALFVQSAGISFEDLPDKLKALNDKILINQKKVNSTISTIRQEINSFYARTKIEKYKLVIDDMEKKNADEKLKALAALVEINKTNSAIKPAKQWAKQFEDWADILDPQKDPKANPNDPQNMENKEKNMEMLMALVRIIEQEQNLHEETLYLEELRKKLNEEATEVKEKLDKAVKDIQTAEKADDKAAAGIAEKSKKEALAGTKEVEGELKKHKDAAVKLAERQNKNIDDLQELSAQVGDKKVKDLMDKAENAMDEAARILKKGDTGIKATSAESAAVELLVSIFMMDQNSKSMMSMMQQMMGQQGMGNSPGGNPTGGTAEEPTNVNGNADGNKAADRDQKKHNVSMEEIPVEFREALESYYKEVEKAVE